MPTALSSCPAEGLPVADLLQRYAIQKAAFYERAKALGIKFTKRSNRSYASADQVGRLDWVHDHLITGGTLTDIDEFLTDFDEFGASGGLAIQPTELPPRLDPSSALFALAEMIATRIPRTDPLAPARALEEAAAHGWLLPTKVLCEILGQR